jgi:hypothetical protein
MQLIRHILEQSAQIIRNINDKDTRFQKEGVWLAVSRPRENIHPQPVLQAAV